MTQTSIPKQNNIGRGNIKWGEGFHLNHLKFKPFGNCVLEKHRRVTYLYPTLHSLLTPWMGLLLNYSVMTFAECYLHDSTWHEELRLAHSQPFGDIPTHNWKLETFYPYTITYAIHAVCLPLYTGLQALTNTTVTFFQKKKSNGHLSYQALHSLITALRNRELFNWKLLQFSFFFPIFLQCFSVSQLY